MSLFANRKPQVVASDYHSLTEGQMSLSSAEMYGHRARDTGSHSEVGENVKKATDELIREIKQLELRVANLERKVR
jgi:hypothetical protein